MLAARLALKNIQASAQMAGRLSTQKISFPRLGLHPVTTRHASILTRRSQPVRLSALSCSMRRLMSTEAGAEVSFFRSPIAWWRHNNAKVKALFKQYGYFAVATYLGVYVCTLGGLYALVRLGVIKGPDVNTWLNNWAVKKAVTSKEINLSPEFLEFATAWILTKPTEPVRLIATIALVPFLAKRAPERVLRFFRALPTQQASAASATTAATGQASAVAKAALDAAPKKVADDAVRRSGMW